MRYKYFFVFCLIFTHFLYSITEACWGRAAPHYGETSDDYNIKVGSDLVLNCSLRSHFFPEIVERPINSSDLVFEKGGLDYSNFTQKINDLTLQLKIPRATVNDSGMYICKILTPTTKPVVCGSIVNVGYPPKPVSNFTCLSRNFMNIFCSWDIEKSTVQTNYSIVNNMLNLEHLDKVCPNSTRNSTSCEWSSDTDPVLSFMSRNLYFTVKVNNTLGSTETKFEVDTFAIVIPDRPIDLKPINVGTQFITVQWKPPKIIFPRGTVKFNLQFEVSIGKLYHNSNDVQIFDAGNNASEYTLENLIPYVSYEISVRCRSVFAKKENTWSEMISVVVQTLPDVPYVTPKTIPEAYEIHNYGNLRSITLYWKTIPELLHNGENFHYHIKYFENLPTAISYISYVNSSLSFVKVRELLDNFSYIFHIYSANHKGISEKYESITVDVQDKILPKDVRAISQDFGRYNLSWNATNINHDNFVVFWCSSLKPWRTRCDSHVQWINENLTENSVILNLIDENTNFQFAVASKTGNSSSGMQWASCIVPYKAALGKIKNVWVDAKSSTSLNVIWNLDCDAQKSAVKRYEITCCRINKTEKCKVSIVRNPNAESYLVNRLHPFSNYSVKIRAFNKENLPSEDSDIKEQRTLPGAPSDPPQNVQVFSKTNSSFYVSWTPPLELNGPLTEYIVSLSDFEKVVPINGSETNYSLKIDGRQPFGIYEVWVKACVNHDCSQSDPVVVQTDVGVPGRMGPPSIVIEKNSGLKVSWSEPAKPNGPIDFYIIEWHEMDQNTTFNRNNIMKVSSANSVHIGWNCSNLEDIDVEYLFSIQAVNLKEGISLLGPLSNSTSVVVCSMSYDLAMIIGIAIGGTLALAFLMLLIYKLVKWMRDKIHQVKSIAIRLPKGLEGPETNPLNNYEYFKHGLNVNIQQSSNDRLSYIIEENESKNRHGSGSSQFSNSSAEELIFKNGKCTKFGRMPSGDSSGCSSMSSNTTPRNYLQSDSGTESDFAIPPSPDSAITEQSLTGSHKPLLPILMEVHDQLSSEQPSSPQSISSDKLLYRRKIAFDDMTLKSNHPYSKFGVAGNSESSVPWHVNPLAFYSCNLANSEPSVFDVQKTERQNTVVTPYSKVGLAKSSSDIVGIPLGKETGYSKVGYPTSQKRFSIPSNVNPIATVMLENTDEQEWSNVKKNSNSKISYKQPLMVSTNDVLPDCGYIKFGIKGKKPSPGYVPFNDVKGQQHNTSLVASLNPKILKDQQNNSFLSSSINPLDDNNFLHSSSIDKDQVEVQDDVEWPHNSFECENGILVNDPPEVLFSDSFLQDSVNDSLQETGVYNSFTRNFDVSPHKLPFEPDTHYTFDPIPFGLSTENHDFAPNPQNEYLDCSPILFLSGNSPLEKSQSYRPCCGKTDSYDRHNEVVVNPGTLKNGYVPVSTLSDSMCDRTLSYLPNSNSSPLTIFSNGVCAEADNYVTPSNKGDLRLLRDNSLTKRSSVVPSKQKNSLKDTPQSIQNGIGYSNGSLTYILKPLPKMESEICEV